MSTSTGLCCHHVLSVGNVGDHPCMLAWLSPSQVLASKLPGAHGAICVVACGSVQSRVNLLQVMSKALKEAGYYKGKGVVRKVLKRFVAEISMLDGGDILQVDQAELETVLPQPGAAVRMLQGPFKGCKASMVGIDEHNFKAKVRLMDGKQAGKILDADYEDISKLGTGS